MSFGLRRSHFIDEFDRKMVEQAGFRPSDGFLGSHDAPPVYTPELALVIAKLEAAAQDAAPPTYDSDEA